MTRDYQTFKELIKNNDVEAKNTNYEKCKNCAAKNKGNTCCAMMPCEIKAEDIVGGVTEETIIKLLNTGLVAIDCWDDNMGSGEKVEMPTTYYLRMRARNDSRAVSFSWGGRAWR